MTNSAIRIVFFGNERLATGLPQIQPQLLPNLLTAGYQVSTVVSNNHPLTGTNKRVAEIDELAHQNHIPILAPANPINILDQLKSYHPTVGVLVAYGRIIPQPIIDIFPYGIINLHPSLLPAYRGSTPIEQTILDGVSETGVSIMRLQQTMDTGPILAQKRLPLSGNEQKNDLATKLLTQGSEMIMALLKDINNTTNNFSIQDNNLSTYTKLIKKADGQIDLTHSAINLERQIRAYAGWPGSYTTLAGKDIIITAAHVETLRGKPGTAFMHNRSLGLYAAQDALIIDRLKPAGKREMTGPEFLAGNPI